MRRNADPSSPRIPLRVVIFVLALLSIPMSSPAGVQQIGAHFFGENGNGYPGDLKATLDVGLRGTTDGAIQVGHGSLTITPTASPVPSRVLAVMFVNAYRDDFDNWHVTGQGVESSGCTSSITSVGRFASGTLDLQPIQGCTTETPMIFYGGLDVSRQAIWRASGQGTVSQADGTTWTLSMDVSALNPEPEPNYVQTQGVGNGSFTRTDEDGTTSGAFHVLCVEMRADEGLMFDGYDARVSGLALTSGGALLSFELLNYRHDGYPGVDPADQLAVTLWNTSFFDVTSRCPSVRFPETFLLDEGAFSVVLT